MLWQFDAVLFDLDGVLTPTSDLHVRAWRETLAPVCDAAGVRAYTDADYFEHVDGRPRYDGVRALLDSRGIALPQGRPQDAPGAATVCAIGNAKNARFEGILREEGVTPFPGSLRLLDELAVTTTKLAVVSSSRNAAAVLRAAGLAGRFPVVVDGALAARENLAGKPAPDTFLLAAHLLGAPPARTMVVEDATSGVRAARAGAFARIVGVDRGVGALALLTAGADVVVRDLDELVAA